MLRARMVASPLAPDSRAAQLLQRSERLSRRTDSVRSHSRQTRMRCCLNFAIRRSRADQSVANCGLIQANECTELPIFDGQLAGVVARSATGRFCHGHFLHPMNSTSYLGTPHAL